MVGTVEDWAWAVSEDAASLRSLVTPGMGVGTLAGLRSRWPAERVAVVAELVEARTRATSKFGDAAERMACDREGVEMASSARAAAHKAGRFVAALGCGSRVVDACCGIGGDAVGLEAAGLGVTAVDVDPRRAWMAAHNTGCEGIAGDVRSIDRSIDGLHIDPSRRGGGRRTRDGGEFEPPLDDVVTLLGRARVGAVKLNPGVDAAGLPGGELEIISEAGRLTQAVLWTGFAPAQPRRATLLGDDGSVHSLAGTPDRPFDAAPVGSWVHTFDPSVERADLVHMLIEETGLSLVHPGTGLLTGDEPSGSPWVRAFRVIEDRAWNLKQLRSAMRSLDAGVVTVKTRGGMVDPDRLSKDLRGGPGGRDLVVFVLRVGEKPRAIIAEPAQHDAPPAGGRPGDGAKGGVA
jgi:hypothetical protein